LNSPTNGFCSGTLTISGNSGNAVCQLSSPDTRYVLACAMQKPSGIATLASLIATTPNRALLSISSPGPVIAPNVGTLPPKTVPLTVKNLTGAKVASMGPPSNPAEGPQAPFSYSGGDYPGGSGTCGEELEGNASCTIIL